MLSSLRPLVADRFNMRSVIIASSASKWSTAPRKTRSPITSFHPLTLSSLLGNPSIKYFLLKPYASIAFLIKRQVITTGTILPSAIYELIRSPSGDPLSLSALNKSPADKCTNPNSYTSLVH